MLQHRAGPVVGCMESAEREQCLDELAGACHSTRSPLWTALCSIFFLGDQKSQRPQVHRRGQCANTSNAIRARCEIDVSQVA